MKHILTTIVCLMFSFSLFAQKVPSIEIFDLEMKPANTASTIQNNGRPAVLVFWATFNQLSKKFLNELQEVYPEWRERYGVNVSVISIDDSRHYNEVKNYVLSKEWDYQILLDPNQDFKRLMGVSNIPHIFVVNGRGDIVWQTTTVSPGTTLYQIEQNL